MGVPSEFIFLSGVRERPGLYNYFKHYRGAYAPRT